MRAHARSTGVAEARGLDSRGSDGRVKLHSSTARDALRKGFASAPSTRDLSRPLVCRRWETLILSHASRAAAVLPRCLDTPCQSQDAGPLDAERTAARTFQNRTTSVRRLDITADSCKRKHNSAELRARDALPPRGALPCQCLASPEWRSDRSTRCAQPGCCCVR